MIEKIKKIEEKVNTEEELINFLQQIDLANDLILKNPEGKVSEILREKVIDEIFSVLAEIEKEVIGREEKKFEEKKSEFLKEKEKIEGKLKFVLEKEEKLEKSLEKIEKKEKKSKGNEKEKEIEKERWILEEERIEIEKEKWELKEKLKEIEQNLMNLMPQKIEVQKDIIFFLKLLRDNLIALPKINFKVAIEPSPKTISKISLWLKENLKKKFVLSFEIDPKIIGGAIIEYQGRIFDSTLSKEIKKLRKHGNFIKI